MRKALGCTVLSATLAGGLALPAHGVPGTDPSPSGTPVAQAALSPDAEAAAAQRPVLSPGTRNPAVVLVQRALGVSPASGYYGTLTEAAVRAWQRAASLPVSGVVDAAGWQVLLGGPAVEAGTVLSAAAVRPAAAAATRPRLRMGTRSPAVVYVQRKLGVAPATGYYGPLTKGAVRRLQRAEGLKATGTVTRATWTVLLAMQATPRADLPAPAPDAAPAPAQDPAPQPAPPAVTPEQAAKARPPLAQGAGPDDPAVIFVQRFLNVSPTTGYFGPMTRAAVRTYQSGLGLSPDGSIGPRTWDAILAGRKVPNQPRAERPAAGRPNASIPTPKHRLPEAPAARDHALVFALAQVGKPYVLGGNGPAVFDCSGLVQQAYLSAGVKLPRLASQQRFAGVQVPIDQLLPGDLLYYQNGSARRGHISMYAGNGLVVEAANPRRGVRMRTLHEAWYRDRFVAAVRIG